MLKLYIRFWLKFADKSKGAGQAKLTQSEFRYPNQSLLIRKRGGTFQRQGISFLSLSFMLVQVRITVIPT